MRPPDPQQPRPRSLPIIAPAHIRSLAEQSRRSERRLQRALKRRRRKRNRRHRASARRGGKSYEQEGWLAWLSTRTCKSAALAIPFAALLVFDSAALAFCVLRAPCHMPRPIIATGGADRNAWFRRRRRCSYHSAHWAACCLHARSRCWRSRHATSLLQAQGVRPERQRSARPRAARARRRRPATRAAAPPCAAAASPPSMPATAAPTPCTRPPPPPPSVQPPTPAPLLVDAPALDAPVQGFEWATDSLLTDGDGDEAHDFFEADELTSVRRTSEQRLSRRPHLPLPEAPVWPPYARHASRTYFSVGRQQQLSMTGGGAEWDHAQAAFPPLAWPLTIGSLDWVELQVATVLMDFADGYRGARPKRAFFVTNTQDCRSNGAHWISIAISMQWLNPNTGLPVWP